MIGKLDRDLIGYKKIRNDFGLAIVVMLIPKGARYYMKDGRSIQDNIDRVAEWPLTSIEHRKMRADRVFCLGVFGIDGMHTEFKHGGYYDAQHAKSIKWIPGKVIKPDCFDMTDTDCTNGIHFFLNVEDAIHWS